MRLSHAPILLSGALLCTAATVPVQGEKLAEQQFKNIVSFKGQKATDILPAMEFMSASLKVGCEYCHNMQDLASDEKPQKNAARDMVSMQRDINLKHFNGRLEITCATCHGGREHPLAVAPIQGVEVRPQRDTSVKPAEVLAAYAKAVGTGPIAGWRLEGKSKFMGQDITLAATYAGGKYVILMHGANLDIKQGYDGVTTWFGPNILPPEVAAPFAHENMIFTGPSTLPPLTTSSGGSVKIGDREMQTVSGPIAGEKGRGSFYFDQKTGLLARAVFSEPTVIGTNVRIIDYANYKKVGGIQLPMRVSIHSGDQDVDRVFTSAKPETKIDPASFAPPK